MNPLTIRHAAVEYPKPQILTRQMQPLTGFYSYGRTTHPEPLYRVQPKTAADVAFLQRLVRDKERFVPFFGDGLLISHNALMSA
jgi:hypothetical protein